MKEFRFSRRGFVQQSAVVTLAFAGLRNVFEQKSYAATATDLDDTLEKDFYGIIDLPPEFSYEILSEQGERMDDGLHVPGKHDGMGAFAGPNGTTLLVRNHEVEPTWTEYSPFGARRSGLRRIDRGKLYDAGKGKRPGLGGTTTLIYDTRSKRLLKHFLSLAGTYRNCSGGITPWNSWVTCEEDVTLADGDTEKDHGYNFEVPAVDRMQLADPVPLKAMGRFRHEAIAVDPRTGIVYQTEDRFEGLFYRFIPASAGRLHEGGRLQALRVRDLRQADTRNWRTEKFRVGEKHAVEWTDVRNIESPDDDMRFQGYFELGAARFARGEGIWYGRDGLIFACTNGGTKKKGQIWNYHPSPKEGTAGEAGEPGTLSLYLEPNDGKIVENCDNVTIAPWGDLIVCEDRERPQHLVGVTPQGGFYHLGRTSISEFAGACFSIDGTTLFVNIQTPGMTLAITGPWEKLHAHA